MSDPYELRGGSFVSRERWLESLRLMRGFRFDLRPGDPAVYAGGDLRVRFGHESIAGNQDVMIEVRIDVHVPAADAPDEVRQHHLAEIARVLALRPPLTMELHLEMVRAWLMGGGDAVRAAMDRTLDRYRERGWDDELLADHQRLRRSWDQRDSRLEQVLLLEAQGYTAAHFVGEWLLAVGFVHASGGVLVPPLQEVGESAAQLLEADRFATGLAEAHRTCELMAAAGGLGEEQLFGGWSSLTGSGS